MAFRFEDRGLTLRLFVSMRDAMAYPTAREPARYAVGWLAKNDAGRWIDGDGVLPPNWEPEPELLNRSLGLTPQLSGGVAVRLSARLGHL